MIKKVSPFLLFILILYTLSYGFTTNEVSPSNNPSKFYINGSPYIVESSTDTISVKIKSKRGIIKYNYSQSSASVEESTDTINWDTLFSNCWLDIYVKDATGTYNLATPISRTFTQSATTEYFDLIIDSTFAQGTSKATNRFGVNNRGVYRKLTYSMSDWGVPRKVIFRAYSPYYTDNISSATGDFYQKGYALTDWSDVGICTYSIQDGTISVTLIEDATGEILLDPSVGGSAPGSYYEIISDASPGYKIRFSSGGTTRQPSVDAIVLNDLVIPATASWDGNDNTDLIDAIGVVTIDIPSYDIGDNGYGMTEVSNYWVDIASCNSALFFRVYFYGTNSNGKSLYTDKIYSFYPKFFVINQNSVTDSIGTDYANKKSWDLQFIEGKLKTVQTGYSSEGILFDHYDTNLKQLDFSGNEQYRLPGSFTVYNKDNYGMFFNLVDSDHSLLVARSLYTDFLSAGRYINTFRWTGLSPASDNLYTSADYYSVDHTLGFSPYTVFYYPYKDILDATTGQEIAASWWIPAGTYDNYDSYSARRYDEDFSTADMIYGSTVDWWAPYTTISQRQWVDGWDVSTGSYVYAVDPNLNTCKFTWNCSSYPKVDPVVRIMGLTGNNVYVKVNDSTIPSSEYIADKIIFSGTATGINANVVIDTHQASPLYMPNGFFIGATIHFGGIYGIINGSTSTEFTQSSPYYEESLRKFRSGGPIVTVDNWVGGIPTPGTYTIDNIAVVAFNKTFTGTDVEIYGDGASTPTSTPTNTPSNTPTDTPTNTPLFTATPTIDRENRSIPDILFELATYYSIDPNIESVADMFTELGNQIGFNPEEKSVGDVIFNYANTPSNTPTDTPTVTPTNTPT